MRNAVILILLLISSASYSDDLRGTWKGTGHSSDSTTIEISFQVILQKDSMVGVFLNNPTTFTLADSSFNGTDLHLLQSKLQLRNWNKDLLEKKAKGEEVSLYQEIKFDGALTKNYNHLSGEFTYMGKVYHADLYRGDQSAFRPQEPQKPFPYYSENVKFTNKKDSVVLSGTLTLPNKGGKFPVVILKSGSNPLDRDGEANFHKPFLLLADYLTRHGIAVLRYDDRGTGKSTGDFWKSTALDFVGDIEAGFELLAARKDIKANKIGLIGHSEGGMVVSMAASQNEDFKFVVMLGGTGVSLRNIFNLQTELKYKNGESSKELFDFFKKLDNEIYTLTDQNVEPKVIFNSLTHYRDEFIQLATNISPEINENDIPIKILFASILGVKTSIHNLFNLKAIPSDYIEKITCPVLSLNGSKDMQVNAEISQQAIRKALLKAGNKDFKILELEELNHAFQECKTGSIKEALTIEQTFSPKALDIMTKWILAHVED